MLVQEALCRINFRCRAMFRRIGNAQTRGGKLSRCCSTKVAAYGWHVWCPQPPSLLWHSFDFSNVSAQISSNPSEDSVVYTFCATTTWLSILPLQMCLFSRFNHELQDFDGQSNRLLWPGPQVGQREVVASVPTTLLDFVLKHHL